MTAAAAFIAWFGAAVVVLSDGRRGLALGLALVTAALSALAWASGEPLGAAALFAGGALAAIQRLRHGPDGWRLMPPGSTPRLILVVAAGAIALWIAVSVTSGAGGSLRFASLAVLGLMGARLLTGRDPAVGLTAVGGMALALAAAAGLAATQAGPAPYMFAALIAAGASFVRLTEPHVA